MPKMRLSGNEKYHCNICKGKDKFNSRSKYNMRVHIFNEHFDELCKVK